MVPRETWIGRFWNSAHRGLGEDHASTRVAVGNLVFDLEQVGETGPEFDALRVWLKDHAAPE